MVVLEMCSWVTGSLENSYKISVLYQNAQLTVALWVCSFHQYM